MQRLTSQAECRSRQNLLQVRLRAQLFGARYEDDDERERSASSPSLVDRDSVSASRVSLTARRDRERRLDKQIQAAQRRLRERSSHPAPAPAAAAPPSRSKLPPTRVDSTAPVAAKPFEAAGLSITSVRFCVEKALRATCTCFQQLHAFAMSEPRVPKADAELGVFVTQWEMERVLRELFDGPGGPSPHFVLVDPLYTGVPLELLCQAAWFVPFDQLPRLRSLVLQITRRHLNEHKLAVLNRHLQRQLLLIPYSTRLQQVLLRFSHRPTKQEPHESDELAGDERDEDDDGEDSVSTAPPLVHCDARLVQELLECVAVPVSPELVQGLGDGDFLLLSPFELFQRWRLSSVLCVQRLVFLRFLIKAIATERSGGSLASDLLLAGASERHKSHNSVTQAIRTVQFRTKARTGGQDEPSTKPSAALSSAAGTHGSVASSVASNNNNNDDDDRKEEITTTTTTTKTVDTKSEDANELRLNQLQSRLGVSLIRLGEVMPWLLTKAAGGSPAIRATFLAASAFHQSLDVMIKSRLALDCDVMDTLQHFVETIEAIISAHEAPRANAADSRVLSHSAVAAATTVRGRGQDGVDSVPEQDEFPPPFPDLTRDEEKAVFPPPYESTGASYWSFKPDLPPPASASEARRPPHSCTAAAQPSPGVGAYDVQRSERTTFHQRAGFSFRKAGDAHSPSPSPSAVSTPSKPRVHKSSLARALSPVVFEDAPSLQRSDSGTSDRMEKAPGDSSSLNDNDSTRQGGGDSAPEYHEGNDGGGDDDDERLEVDVLNALRRQHSMVSAWAAKGDSSNQVAVE
ncbi:hypothetical protein PybrP1_004716 [[Pythium] brassicae (nom. inval.)]|nr:hypothetical protein PybrP1_004716 [[Pythium] brassicae (nom. inval.)]